MNIAVPTALKRLDLQLTAIGVLLFKQQDSDHTQPARLCFHSAIAAHARVTSSNDGVQNVKISDEERVKFPQRQSIEVRAMVFFPDHRPNTCPKVDYTTDNDPELSEEEYSKVSAARKKVTMFPVPASEVRD